MGDDVLSQEAFVEVAREVKSAGSVTHVGEQRRREKKGLHQEVDPGAYGLIRRSLPRLEPEDKRFTLTVGTPMLVERRFDTTGSMGDNVAIAFKVLPKSYSLLKERVLARYDLQILNGIYQDIADEYVMYRSQAEMGDKIAKQLTYMAPERAGNDFEEDPQYSVFGGAFLTSAFINKYDLKYYDLSLGDAPGRDRLDPATLVRIYGKSVFEKVIENGFQINEKNLPSAQEAGTELQKKAHTFFFQIGDHPETTKYWRSIVGREHVVRMPSDTQLLPYVEAVVIGLTEGTLDLQSVVDFLRELDVEGDYARSIAKYVSHIPIGVQALQPNFSRIPLKGAGFANKGDLWPIGFDTDGNPLLKDTKPASVSKNKVEQMKKGKKIWL